MSTATLPNLALLAIITVTRIVTLFLLHHELEKTQ
jgi:hypothetical protein